MPFVSASYEQYGDAGLFRDVVAKAGSDPGRIADALGERLVVGSADDVAIELKRIVERLGVTDWWSGCSGSECRATSWRTPSSDLAARSSHKCRSDPRWSVGDHGTELRDRYPLQSWEIT